MLIGMGVQLHAKRSPRVPFLLPLLSSSIQDQFYSMGGTGNDVYTNLQMDQLNLIIRLKGIKFVLIF